MDCVIKIIKGPEEGREFHLSGGETILGRSLKAQVRLTQEKVSFEHAVVTRLGDEYFIENLSAGGTLVNDEKITGKVKLRERDRVQLGPETIFRVENAPGSGKMTRQRRILFIAAGSAVVLLLVVLLFDPFSGSAPRQNWSRANTMLTDWIQSETRAGKLPPEAASLFHEAWHAELVHDKTAGADWFKLKVLLAGSDPKTNIVRLSAYHKGALAKLLDINNHDPQLDHEEMGAALVQFVDRRLEASQK